MESEYAFEIGEEGNDHNILNVLFNAQTHTFLKKYLRPGMRVLEIGCATGTMTRWLADQIGLDGYVLGIDNSEKQIKAAILQTPTDVNNISFKTHSAYDILSLNTMFDLVYCRFTLHHLEHPKQVIHHIHEILNPNGIYIGIEGIVEHAFSYPSHSGWQTPSSQNTHDPLDKNIGKKLAHLASHVGFKIQKAYLYQPLIFETKVKRMLLDNMKLSRDYEIRHQHTTSEEWQLRFDELKACIDNNDITIGFYSAGFTAAKK